MVVAVPAMRVVQMAGDEIIDMIPVRDGLMAAAGAMSVRGHMTAAGMPGGACIRVDGAYLEYMFIDVIPVRVVQMAVVQIVHMSVVEHAGVAAARSMCMRMAFVPG